MERKLNFYLELFFFLVEMIFYLELDRERSKLFGTAYNPIANKVHKTRKSLGH